MFVLFVHYFRNDGEQQKLIKTERYFDLNIQNIQKLLTLTVLVTKNDIMLMLTFLPPLPPS